MPRIRIEPKYVYTMSHGAIAVPSSNGTGYDSGRHMNGQIFDKDYFPEQHTDTKFPITPITNLPTQGYKHNQRIGDRITVTTLQLKMNLYLAGAFIRPHIGSIFNCVTFNETTNPNGVKFLDSPDEAGQWVSGAGNAVSYRWFKLRFMVVEFEKGLSTDQDDIYTWFVNTYCPYRDKTTEHGDLADCISVHSNVLRMTTPYTGKFNILMDRPILISSAKPMYQLDVNIPINRQYIFEEATQKLISPNIACFILPPLSYEVDMDPASGFDYNLAFLHNYMDSTATGYTSMPWFNYTIWQKLNYTDL